MHPVQPDTSYHIFNHANGFENIFRHEANYYFFMEKYRKHIDPIAETYAWCLMPNHFHFVVRIRKRSVIINTLSKTNTFPKVLNFGKDLKDINEISNTDIEKYLSKQFANFFSSYTQSFNKVYRRMGSLFIKNFKREPITDKTHFLNTIIYTHRNPIHHGFCKQFDEWPYSSYNEIISGSATSIEIEKLLKITNGLDNFMQIHQRSLNKLDIENYSEIQDLL